MTYDKAREILAVLTIAVGAAVVGYIVFEIALFLARWL